MGSKPTILGDHADVLVVDDMLASPQTELFSAVATELHRRVERATELRRGAEQTAEWLRSELLAMERRALRAEARLAAVEERLYVLESERQS